MSQRNNLRISVIAGLVVGLGFAAHGCLDRPVAPVVPNLSSGVRIPVVNNAIESVDILFEIDNSNSMSQNQQNLSENFGVLIDTLVNPPVDPMTMRARYPPVKSMHVGVISSDLGTPGSVVPSCANSDAGDNGFLNPIRNGLAIRTHQPWMTAPPGRRPARCTMDMNQYPTFLTFDSMQINPNDPMQTYQRNFRDDFVCNAYLSTGGCGLEQQLESMYRALVIHDARATPGNMSPNAGFVRDNAVLALVMVSDEEDGSTRDTRYMEAGFPVRDAISVFDSTSPDWSSNDLNLRFYMYAPGSAQDPTWPLDRYIDPMRPNRGFTSLKAGRPDQVIFAAIAGVPINLPTTRGASGEETVDWNMLLGSMPDGSNGYTGMSPEGPISMRQRNMDPMCSTRVVPACRREGSSYNPMACDANTQYFAWPSRRIAEVARRFAVTYNNGTISSICKNDYRGALAQIVERIQQRLSGRCLPRPLEYTLPLCSATVTTNCRQPTQAASVNCIVREVLPAGMSAAAACTTARGRMPGQRDTAQMRDTCVVTQVPVVPGQPPMGSAQGFYYDTRPDPAAPSCTQHIEFTSNAGLAAGASAIIECVQQVSTGSGATM
jgi:hypothetical protein